MRRVLTRDLLLLMALLVVGIPVVPASAAESHIWTVPVAKPASLRSPKGTAVDMRPGVEPSLVVADDGSHKLLRIYADGRVVTIAGSGETCRNGGCNEGESGRKAALGELSEVAVASDGTVVFIEGGGRSFGRTAEGWVTEGWLPSKSVRVIDAKTGLLSTAVDSRSKIPDGDPSFPVEPNHISVSLGQVFVSGSSDGRTFIWTMKPEPSGHWKLHAVAGGGRRAIIGSEPLPATQVALDRIHALSPAVPGGLLVQSCGAILEIASKDGVNFTVRKLPIDLSKLTAIPLWSYLFLGRTLAQDRDNSIIFGTNSSIDGVATKKSALWRIDGNSGSQIVAVSSEINQPAVNDGAALPPNNRCASYLTAAPGGGFFLTDCVTNTLRYIGPAASDTKLASMVERAVKAHESKDIEEVQRITDALEWASRTDAYQVLLPRFPGRDERWAATDPRSIALDVRHLILSYLTRGQNDWMRAMRGRAWP